MEVIPVNTIRRACLSLRPNTTFHKILPLIELRRESRLGKMAASWRMRRCANSPLVLLLIFAGNRNVSGCADAVFDMSRF